MRYLILLFLIIGVIGIALPLNNHAFGAITAGTSFCGAFPTHPECTGWRVTPISDNFWFCEYVNLPTMCKNPPDPEKQIVPRTGNSCCGILNSHTPKNISLYDVKFEEMNQKGKSLKFSSNELLIWTEKDHYSLGERVDVYGKFNFDDPVLRTNKFVDVSLNDRIVIRNLPVNDNGWFAGYFILSNPSLYYTGSNLISVTYFHSPTVFGPDKFNQSNYVVNTGDITTKPFFIDVKSASGKISYDIVTESGYPARMDLTIVRLEDPNGLVFSLPSISSVKDISEYSKLLVSGEYTITATKGNYTVSQVFEYPKN